MSYASSPETCGPPETCGRNSTLFVDSPQDGSPQPGDSALSTDVKLAVDVGGLEMRNPVTVASGTFGAGEEYADFVDLSRLGAVTTKGVSLEPWEGNDSPRIAETPAGMLNSIGLQNPGVEAFCAHQLAFLAGIDTRVIVNVSGHSNDEYVRVIERLERESAVDAYELNISCPNVDAGGMAIGTDPRAAAAVTAACREVTQRPLIVKLSPNVTSPAEIARAVCDAGADAVSLVNTLVGMAIDAHRRRPVLARGTGGLSGPAIKPVALAQVWQVSRAVDVPVIGMGGICTGEDAIEFMLAGASAVAVGAANFADPLATMHVLDGIVEFCEAEGVRDVTELVGALETR